MTSPISLTILGSLVLAAAGFTAHQKMSRRGNMNSGDGRNALILNSDSTRKKRGSREELTATKSENTLRKLDFDLADLPPHLAKKRLLLIRERDACKASGLGLKHPAVLGLTKKIEELERNPLPNLRAPQSLSVRYRELVWKRELRRNAGLGQGHPTMQSLGREIEQLTKEIEQLQFPPSQ